MSWSVGGDQTFSKVLSVPNALRNYNDKLQGYSTKSSIIFLNGQDAKNNHLNVGKFSLIESSVQLLTVSSLAKSGARSPDMPYQADLLMTRLKEEEQCDWDNDWKMITFFVGVSSMIDSFIS